jgi:hypothetical protein
MSKLKKKRQEGAGCWWLMPVILALQETAIRKTVVQSWPSANNSPDPISKKPITKKGWFSCLSGKSVSLASMRP